jgi:methyl-accepting chemotaxis protein
VETQRATDEINANIAALQHAARGSISAVGEVIATIDQLAPSFSAISNAVARQGEIIGEAAATANRSRSAVEEAATRAEGMRARSETVADGVTGVRSATDRLTAASESTAARLMSVLRQTRIGDRRAHDRFPAFVAARLKAGGRTIETETVDVSMGGVLLRRTGQADGLAILGRASVDIRDVGCFDCRIVGLSPDGIHLAFDDPENGAVAAFVARVRDEYDALIDRCTQAASRIGALFESALERGDIDEQALFDTDYQPVPGTNPLQVLTEAVPFLELTLQPLQEQLLATDQKMTFCAAVDRNGYLPVHNLVFSKPQKPDDPVWNAANARNRRIFDDRAGLAAARNTRPFLVQAYRRDMGGGVTVLMKEIDAPITVRGRHWGGFRTAYKA